MLAFVSQIVVLIAGVSLCLFAVWGLYAPLKLMYSVKAVMDADWGIYFAVLLRVALGVALVLSASDSRFPSVFTILGWVAIVAGLVAAILGRARLRRFVNWWVDRFSPSSIRLWVVFALAFGVTLIYGGS